MHILFISTDKKIFDKGSAVRERMILYGRLFSALHIIVITKSGDPYEKETLAENVFVYPSQSRFRLFASSSVERIASVIKPIDVVSAQDVEFASVSRRIADLHNACYEQQVHTDITNPEFRKDGWKNWMRYRYAKEYLPKADCVRAVSETLAKTIAREFPLKNPPAVLPVFEDFTPFFEAQKTNELHTRFPQFNFIVLVASRLTREKNVGDALRAFSAVLKEDTRAGLLIVGDGPEREQLEKKAHELGIEKSVVFLGWQSDMAPYFKNADVFLQTSHYEGYGLSVLEACASETPVVSTAVGVVGDMLKNREHLLASPVGDVAMLSAHLVELLKDNTLRKRLAYNGKEQVKECCVQSKEEYLARFKDLMERCRKTEKKDEFEN